LEEKGKRGLDGGGSLLQIRRNEGKPRCMGEELWLVNQREEGNKGRKKDIQEKGRRRKST